MSLKFLMKDRFFQIKDFENYSINIFGDVKNTTSNKILKPFLDGRGYYELHFRENNIRTHKKIHKLLAELFIPNYEKKKCVDHIDRNPKNNKLSNLRWATHTENNRNRTKSSNNKSGRTGVSFDTRDRRWKSSIHLNNKYISLGQYKTIEEAITARKEGEEKYYGEFAPS